MCKEVLVKLSLLSYILTKLTLSGRSIIRKHNYEKVCKIMVNNKRTQIWPIAYLENITRNATIGTVLL